MSSAPANARTSVRDNASGTGTLVLFVLRRERFTLPWWLLGIGLLLGYQSVGSQALYDSPAKLARLRETIGANAAAVAMNGPTRLLDSIGGEVLFEIFAYLAVVVALLNMFLIDRHTRTDEETGRAELFRSARVGRRAPALAALAVAGVADAAVAMVVFATAAGTGLPVPGSALLAFSVAGVGITFAALTAVAAQVFENPRSVYGAVALALAAAYVLRAVGDIGNGAASWLSPIGWGQRTYPFVAERWWPLLLFVVASGVLATVAFAVLERRDFGAGLLAYGTGRSTASWALGTPLGLAWRLQRGSLFGWGIGTFVLGAAYGSFADSIDDYLADNPEIAQYLPGGAADAVDAYLALTITISALLASACGIASVLRARGEETAGRAESVLAAPVGRTAWLGSHVAVALVGSAAVLVAGGFGEALSHSLTTGDAAELLRVTGAALGYAPAVWVVVAVAVVAFGWLPTAAVPLSWAAFAYCAVAVLFADSFDLPGWFAEASPFEHTPLAPLDNVTATPLLGLLAVGAAGVLGGFAGLRRRDVGY
ncbi:ABC transporter permease [Nocardia blacklockiae]|uniref:ABC transporter permease n=1 Tax=Nocardia blacklockiae TaxID=480036 RepID=UPI00189380BC|nr:ABC transporter permease [Nocardia blacklockiae]MBF6176623.1 ABC transporter permease [Nocardia blacklockiae]